MTSQDTSIDIENTAATQPVLDSDSDSDTNNQAADSFDLSDIDIAAITDTANLPQPSRPPIQQATYKADATDFVVNEILPLEFTDEGEHLWLHIKKLGMNTAYLAKLLSEWADIPLRDVGYSGLKDRHAVTKLYRLRIPKKQLPATEFAPIDIGEHESVVILAQHWHNKKLNRGTHRANQFIITLRDIEFANDDENTESTEQSLSIEQTAKQRVEQHLARIDDTGVPNYFGPQRFGRQGNNVQSVVTVCPSTARAKAAAQKEQTQTCAARTKYDGAIGSP